MDLKSLFYSKDTDEINELDLDAIDFNITNTKEFIDTYLKEYNKLLQLIRLLILSSLRFGLS